jgi:hypothetical protein
VRTAEKQLRKAAVVTTVTARMRRYRRYLIVLAMALFSFAGLTNSAQAASPAWKVIAATGPTNLPPVQSEVQRVTVQAEGGTFKLAAGAGEAKIMDKAYIGFVDTTQGSPVVTIDELLGEEANFEVGARVAGASQPFEGETFVVSCSTDCKTPGSTVTLSRPAEETLSGEVALIYSKEAIVEEGELPVGAELRATRAGVIAPGTSVTSVAGSTITLSQPPASEYFFEEVVPVIGTETTAPLAYDASEGDLQSAFDALPGLSDAISVAGGPC